MTNYDISIPNALGVPGFYNQGPNWWDSTQTAPSQWNTLDDPRWSGALQLSWNYGTTNFAALRSLHDAEALYFSFQVYAEPSLEANQDGVYFGLQGPAGIPYVFEIEAFSSPALATDAPILGPTLWTSTGASSWSSATPPPQWILPSPPAATPNAPVPRAWVTPAPSTSSNNQWAINVRVPLLFGATAPDPDMTDSGIYLGATVDTLAFSFWCQFNSIMPVSSGVVPFTWPPNLPMPSSLQEAFPAPSGWVNVSTGTGAGTGLSFTPADIGCRFNPSDPTQIGASLTHDTPNPLYVQISNSGPEVVAGAIDASFRLANWGTQAPLLAFAAPQWQEIDPQVVPKSNAAPIPQNGVGEIDYTWNLTTAEAQNYLGPNPIYWTHDCMLVTLSQDLASSQPPPPLVFLNDSCYQNMHIVSASVVEENVEFNVEGLDEYAVGHHVNVYVYVERDNMPRDIPGGTKSSGEEFDRLFGRGPDGQVGATVTWEEAATRVPTIIYHVFAGTNVRVRIAGRQQEILAPMTSFGSFVRHDGALYGWDTALNLTGLTEIAPNWYRVHIPKGGKLVGTTIVRAWDTMRPEGCLTELLKLAAQAWTLFRKLFK